MSTATQPAIEPPAELYGTVRVDDQGKFIEWVGWDRTKDKAVRHAMDDATVLVANNQPGTLYIYRFVREGKVSANIIQPTQ